MRLERLVFIGFVLPILFLASGSSVEASPEEYRQGQKRAKARK